MTARRTITPDIRLLETPVRMRADEFFDNPLE